MAIIVEAQNLLMLVMKLRKKMIDSFNHICAQIKGFHFGRMDIMFQSFEDLAKGKTFKLLKSTELLEPTHMYDPKHSLWFGWKELMRHFHYMYLISKTIIKMAPSI